jgi:hypothetical protein
MIYVTFERGGPKFSNTIARVFALRTAASVESKMATMQHKQIILCCVVVILLSTDAAAWLCTRRALMQWYLKI